MSLNKVMLIGNVGKDPEIRYINANNTGNNDRVATITLATSERYRDASGAVKENTEWHTIIAWRALAEMVDKYVKKGTQLYVEGRLRSRTWTDQTGNKRYVTEIQADAIQLLGKRQDNPATTATAAPASTPSAAPAPQPKPSIVQAAPSLVDDMPEDMPF
ncbi:MAG: single-stranded DNA-binding protein [Bacteroidales bacterium]|nr:single-stranded DNA-binding protein [Bacteroidales bacterium]